MSDRLRHEPFPFLVASLVLAMGCEAEPGRSEPAPIDASADATVADGDGSTEKTSQSRDAEPTPQMADRAMEEGGDGDVQDAPADPCDSDDVAPSVEVSPSQSIVVPAGGSSAVIVLTFSEPVSGLDDALSERAEVSAAESGEVYTITLHSLEPGGAESLTLARGDVRDACGNPLEDDLTIDVTVEPSACDPDVSPPVLHVLPSSPLSLPAGTTASALELLWNEPVSVAAADVAVDHGAQVTVTGEGQSYTLALEGLSPGTTVVSIAATVQDACGNAAQAAAVTIEVAAVDEEAPAIDEQAPPDMALDVAPSTTIQIEFSEALDRAHGTAVISAGGEALEAAAVWSSDDATLTLVPRDSLPLSAEIEVELTGFTDRVGNALPATTFSFTTGADPCAGLPFSVELDAVPQLLDAASGEALVALELSAPFPLEQDAFVLSAVDGGAGMIVDDGLDGTGTSFSLQLGGVAPGERYELALARTQSEDGCSTLLEQTVPLRMREPLAAAAGDCPLPSPLAQHHAAQDECGEGSNHHVTIAEQTSAHLAELGDAFSIAGSYDAEVFNGQDTDYFAFDVSEDGAHATDLNVVLAYGCEFTGLGPRPFSVPTVTLFDALGTQLGTFQAQDEYSDVEGSGGYGFGSAVLAVAGLTGRNRYVVAIDDGPTDVRDTCMSYVLAVELADNTRPSACRPQRLQTLLDGTPQQAVVSEATGQAVVVLKLDQPFALQQADLTIAPTNGGEGRLRAGSLRGEPARYTVTLENVVPGETYDVLVASRAGTCSELSAGFVPVSLIEDLPSGLLCPLPPASTQHHALLDQCDARPSNGTLVDSAPTGFTLAEIGDHFSVGGIYDWSITDLRDDYFEFSLVESGDTLSELEVTLTYGCDFTGTANIPSQRPRVTMVDAAGTAFGTYTAVDTALSVSPTDRFGFGRGRIRVGSTQAGTNTYHLNFGSQTGSNVCMDYRVFVELVDNTTDIVCLGATATSMLTQTRVLAREQAGSALIPIGSRADSGRSRATRSSCSSAAAARARWPRA